MFNFIVQLLWFNFQNILVSWQLGLVEREINEILRGLTVKENSTREITKVTN